MCGLRAVRNRVLAALVVGVVAGCGTGDGETLAPVSGVITANGKPVPSGTMTLYPEAAKGNASQHQPNGVIDANGRYEMYVPGSKKGAPPGWYKVVVYAVDDPQPGKPNKYFVHKKYTDVATTPLLIEVVEKPEPGRYDLKLDR
ncbi:hypothetical protein [Fimbriiglobus ruber]|uniref:Carboxypeptidase regulatory-like domain-containing protein n=1 Tax=Fimbriiglobus ruber TaxID=1908690 RepID=A0A225DM27_9BACT|nr:hypothetical protein [Fimbriiglobus ruber]OWK38259.1 hypothetical protein FRUB_07379 [Fimbriiglobus ruber]